MHPPSRRYNEAEVDRILRHSVTQNVQAADSQGMTLEEIMAVAAEVGISEQAVRDSANALEQKPVRAGAPWLTGCRSYTELERIVDGESTDEAWVDVVAALRSAFEGPTGSTSRLGNSSEWYGGSELTATQVSLTPFAGQTRVKVRLTAWAVPLFVYGIAIVMGGALILTKFSALIQSVFGTNSNGSVWSIIFFIVVLLLTRLAVGSWYRKRTLQMRTALDSVQRVLGQGSSGLAVKDSSQHSLAPDVLEQRER